MRTASIKAVNKCVELVEWKAWNDFFFFFYFAFCWLKRWNALCAHCMNWHRNQWLHWNVNFYQLFVIIKSKKKKKLNQRERGRCLWSLHNVFLVELLCSPITILYEYRAEHPMCYHLVIDTERLGIVNWGLPQGFKIASNCVCFWLRFQHLRWCVVSHIIMLNLIF